MDKELKQKWVSALRSGAYEQVQEYLTGTTNDGHRGYCCLGVLACVSGRFRNELALLDKGTLRYVDGARGLLAPKLQDRLAKMNDSGKSFAEIADYIEAKL